MVLFIGYMVFGYLYAFYKDKELYEHIKAIDKKYIFILNLERKKFMGVESQCMILAADDEKGNIVLIQPEKDIAVGSKIT